MSPSQSACYTLTASGGTLPLLGAQNFRLPARPRGLLEPCAVGVARTALRGAAAVMRQSYPAVKDSPEWTAQGRPGGRSNTDGIRNRFSDSPVTL